MLVIIAGGGGVGKALARRLIDRGEDVVIIDKDPAVCARLREELGVKVVEGDATNMEVLKSAGVDRCDVLLALTGQGNVNVMVALAATACGCRSGRIIVRIDDERYVEVCHMLGIKEVVNPSKSAAIVISEMVRGVKLTTLAEMYYRGYVDVESVKVDVEGHLNDLLSKLLDKVGGGCHPILVLRQGKPLLPNHGLKLRPGDEVVFIKRREAP
ncbi:MAG: hypothetical protein DRJ97_03370 [Thermoprotei archaeon]|nr:MAG: hypothetical protein DRJ97_03370 [Thermoprotei archaeon]